VLGGKGMSLKQKGSNICVAWMLGLVVFFGCATSLAFAATTGSISGTVHDGQGAVLTDVTVTLRDTLTGVTQAITTDQAGFYNFPTLPLGTYLVSFEKTGFAKFEESNVVIDVDSERRVDATLQVGSVQQEVTVSATQAQIETETQQMGEVIGSKEIEAVPLDGRNYTDLLALQPGVVPINVQWYNSAAPPNGGNDGALSISGGQDVHSGYYVNGANTVDLSGGGTFLTPTLDSIAEFRIVTNNAGAEYGGFSAGITNVVTKSGTNRFHGDAFDYLRNSSLNAKDYSLLGSEVGEPTLHQNIFGGTVGGPILHNKVFFFADYQGLRNSDTYNADSDILSDAERGGDMTEEAAAWAGNAKTVGSAYMASLLNQRMGRTDIVQGEHYFQHTTNGVVDYDCNAPGNACVFPTGVIPTTALDPLAQKLINTYLPHANETVNGKAHYFQGGAKQTWSEDKEAGRVDATTRLGQVSGYFFYDPWKQFVPGAWGTTVPGFSASSEGTSALAVASLTTPLGSTAVNNFVASWTYNRNLSGNLPTSGS
jgi:hypothetical protein